MTQSELGERLGVRQTRVSDWIGHSVPTIELALKLREITDIPVEWWTMSADESGPQPAASADPTGTGGH